METKKSVPHSGVDRPELDEETIARFVNEGKTMVIDAIWKRFLELSAIQEQAELHKDLEVLMKYLVEVKEWYPCFAKSTFHLEGLKKQDIEDKKQKQEQEQKRKEHNENTIHLSNGDFVMNKNLNYKEDKS